MKSSDMLLAAARLLQQGPTHHICGALEDAFDEASVPLREHIHKLLDGHLTYGTWLWVEHPDIAAGMTGDDFRAARIQWCEHMAVEFAAKGD